MDDSRSLPADASALLPHKGRMCCLDSVAACREDGAEALATLRPGHALLDGAGRMNPFGFVELAAQAAGAMHGWLAGENRPELAMLVGVQKFAAPGVARLGDTLRIEVSVLGSLDDMLSLGFSIGKDDAEKDDRRLAEGRLSVFVPRANDARLDGMPRAAPPLAGVEATAPGNLPDSVGRCLVDGPNVTENADGKRIVDAAFSFAQDFPGFDGHFPGNPILPGIVQLMAATHAALPDRPTAVESIGRCKFLRPVVPGEKLHARVEVDGADEMDGALRCRAKLDVDGTPCAEAGFVLRVLTC